GQIDDRHRGLDRVVRGQPLDGRRQHLARLHLRGLARLFLEPHRHQLRLALGLDLHLREQLALGFLGGETGDRLGLAPLLGAGRREAPFLLADRLLAPGDLALLRDRVVEPPLELVELARELLFLREHALLDLLDLALALPRLFLEGRTRLERRFLHLELGGLHAVGRFALGFLHDALRLHRSVAGLPLADPLVEEEADDEGKDRDDRVGNEPNPLHCRSIGGTKRGSQIPASAVCRGVSNLVSPGGRRLFRGLQASPSRGACTPPSYTAPLLLTRLKLSSGICTYARTVLTTLQLDSASSSLCRRLATYLRSHAHVVDRTRISGRAPIMERPSVRSETQGAVTTIIIDRPDRRNAIDRPTGQALLAAFRAFE